MRLARLVTVPLFVGILAASIWARPCLAYGRWVPLADGVTVVSMDDTGAKSVVVEFQTFVAVVESPGDDASARALLAELDRRYPNRPVRFLAHTHHHGHSLGAVDPFVERGASIITSAANLERVTTLTGNTEVLGSRVVLTTDRFTISDASNEMTVLLVSQDDYPVPTPEYLVVYLPRQRVLVSGCLYNKPVDYHEVVNQRKRALRDFLGDFGLDVGTLVPTNTTAAGGFEATCSIQTFEATLREGIDPLALADRLAARPVDELERELADLTSWFAERTPRAYDVIVCGNTLLLVRDDPARAAIVLDVATQLFPDDRWAWFALGRARSLDGDPVGAEHAWNTALALGGDAGEREALADAIAEARAAAAG